MESLCIGEPSSACFHSCCPAPFLGLPEPQNRPSEATTGSATAPRQDFISTTAFSLLPHTQFTNHESLPSMDESFSKFNKSYPQFSQTNQADRIRAQEYYHLSLSNHVCLDYTGHDLFSYSQQQIHQYSTDPIASNGPFFDVIYKSISLNSQIQYGGEETEFESKMKKRIMDFMNISEDDYSMVFTANKSSAFKLLADSYPFHTNPNLLTVYDHHSESVEAMIESSTKRGTRVRSAEFHWPSLRIQTKKLRKLMISSKRMKKKRGLFVFPLQSRMTGARYPYMWMSIAQDNGWHVLLDANALGTKDMETLGLSLFQPDFLICSFFKIFGENPSGFSCLFIKKSTASVFNNPTTASSIGIVSLIPSQTSKVESPKEDLPGPSSISTSIAVQQDDETSEIQLIQEPSRKQKEPSVSEIVEMHMSSAQSKSGETELECRGLDHADSLGLIQISTRVRYLVNWLVYALMSLQHPHSENGLPLVTIYGPKVRINRGPNVAFNVFDWKGEKIDPILVQKLADRNSISVSCGFLHNIWFSDKYEEEKERLLEARKSEVKGRKTGNCKKGEGIHSGIYVLTASLGFLTNFEDVYRLWAFVSRFLDADFVEKERWRYMALNQTTIEV